MPRVTFIFTILLSSIVGAETPLEQKLEAFHRNPRKFLNSLPEKTALNMSPQRFTVPFGSKEIVTKEFIDKKVNFRKKLQGSTFDIGVTDSGPLMNDRAENLLERRPVLSNIKAMHQQSLQQGRVKNQPWSDDYWAIANGVSGARYADKEFLELSTWQKKFEYVQSKPALEIFASRNPTEIDLLSPAEKYDLLFHGNESSLTKHMWNEGKMYWEKYENVESWMGICHGWAPAAYMLNRPTNKITVPAFDGTKITFYPSDIKSLASLLWANAGFNTRFVGGRCHEKNPKVDENGRIIEEDCIDTNPATWHKVMINRVGKRQKSFIIDATYDYEVWNQPVVAYEYKYFNPQTRQEVTDVNQGIVPIGQFSEDKFSQYRHPQTQAVIGIEMTIVYVGEILPRQQSTDLEKDDYLAQVSYIYDLELDLDGNILGGEWYLNKHPDFLWTPTHDAVPYTYGDQMLTGAKSWNGKSPLSKDWQRAALMSAKYGTPLEKIIESLIELSRAE